MLEEGKRLTRRIGAAGRERRREDDANVPRLALHFEVRARERQGSLRVTAHLELETRLLAPMNDVAAREPVEVRGRREELARIAALFARTAAESSASMAVLEGEAGIGKSVVASAALRQLADHESLPTVLGARNGPAPLHRPTWKRCGCAARN